MKLHRQPGCWLGSSHSFKECVTAHWSSGFAWIIIGHKHNTEAMDESGRGAFYGRRRCIARYAGAHRKENVGISNDKRCEKHRRRKTKVSPAMLISWGSVGT